MWRLEHSYNLGLVLLVGAIAYFAYGALRGDETTPNALLASAFAVALVVVLIARSRSLDTIGARVRNSVGRRAT